MSGNYTEEMGAVKTDLKTLKRDLSKLTKSVTSDAKENAAELRATAERKAAEAKQNAIEAGTKGRSKARMTIREKPLVSLLATAGVSLVAGALLTRK